MKLTKRLISALTAVCILAAVCSSAFAAEVTETAESAAKETAIVLSDNGVTVDGVAAGQDSSNMVYLSHDIVYYEDRDTYDSGNAYGEGTAADKHSDAEADAHTVVNITQPGTYRISGKLSKGQIAVDLGEDAESNPDAVVTLILDNVDITCTVAPAIIFYQVYECDTAWTAYDNGDAEKYDASATQDTTAAGANMIVADGSTNNVNGSYVAKIYKDDGKEKKLHKYDGAIYSKKSMNVDGESVGTGVLNIIAENEGLDSELHLTLNGGNINIQSQDDGINTNEDGVSVTTVNGGALHIMAGLGDEGDGIDSNGYLVINGGTVIASANPKADSGLDSDMGSYINGGTVIATGSTMDWADTDSKQVTINLQFASARSAASAIVITDTDGKVLFAYDPDQDETTGINNRSYQGAVISSPNFAVGETYYVYVGGDVTGTEVNGLYDVSTVTDFTGTRQIYTGTDVGMGGGPHPDDGQTPPDGNGQRPDDGQTPPDGDGQRPDDGQTPPNGMTPPDGNGQQPGGDTTTVSSNRFYMTDQVNAFSGVADESTATLPFIDVAQGAWYYDAVAYAYSSGLVSGTSSTTFAPDMTMTRGMLVTILHRMEGEPAASGSSFSDVAQGTWYANAVAWAAKNNIAAGYPNGNFGPEDIVTREQTAAILYRYAAYKGYGTDTDADLSKYTDAADISSYALDAMKWANTNGFIVGTSDTTLKPQGSTTRAEATAILSRLAQTMKK
ncbi:MAG: S-layer homology domain-containing protein [Eubacteriales bacterium]|nr:S-layer homology domain-containing protein [Eubacteriales bacterium]